MRLDFQLWKNIEFENSLVLCSQNSINYLGRDGLEFPLVEFVSSLKDVNELTIVTCARLSQPNLIRDLPAASKFTYIFCYYLQKILLYLTKLIFF